ncbi:hypothetical protein LZP73_04610 [Shewanella sp. AS16]|uniref:hypothetical protein n=1 Tax=Shewanella sp. AS16 TaxID=2907625 RepID=UPI001F42D8EA|nr:hypothetical protein [Shewanella sp. AS16]MCE9685500.1 hypothetical protein [Shewanella sp. AS16]
MEEIVGQDKAVPESAEAIIAGESAAEGAVPQHHVPLFHVSLKKLVIMFTLTFGAYQFYWFYKQWQALKQHYALEVWPIARSIFSIFFIHSLYDYVNGYIRETEREYSWKSEGLALTYVLVAIASGILNQLIKADDSSNFLIIVSLFLPLAMLYPLYQGQKAINFALEAVEHPINDRLTWLNWGWIILGALYWIMILGVIAVLLGVLW